MIDIREFKVDNDIWESIDNSKEYFKEELIREVSEKHILYGIEVKEIAHREDCDDVLFLLLDGSNRYAVVHLTWSGKSEDSKTYPITRLYDTLEEMIKNEY